VFINILCCADDIVLLAPTWKAMQALLNCLQSECQLINMSCNTKKTCCMIFKCHQRSLMVCDVFPNLMIAGCNLQFVSTFRYLGHILDDKLHDDTDIQREIRNTFIRCNVLFRRFSKCSMNVKVRLFKTYCLCFYGASLWSHCSVTVMCRFKLCYHKCIKFFFGFRKHDSITQILLMLNLPSFDTLLINAERSFVHRLEMSNNCLIAHLSHMHVYCV
jgi:hypothetical protein